MRFGINTGETLDANTDPIGSAVNAAARIAALAEGGEVLVSDVVRQLAGQAAAIGFDDRGRVRLKGFSERWHLDRTRSNGDTHGVGQPSVGSASSVSFAH